MNNQISHGPCKHYIPNMIKTRIKPQNGDNSLHMDVLADLNELKQAAFLFFTFLLSFPLLCYESGLYIMCPK